LRVGFDAALSGWDDGHAYATVDYAHHITDTPLGELSAFGHAFGGAQMVDGSVTPDFGATGGIELSW
jgi:archaellin